MVDPIIRYSRWNGAYVGDYPRTGERVRTVRAFVEQGDDPRRYAPDLTEEQIAACLAFEGETRDAEEIAIDEERALREAMRERLIAEAGSHVRVCALVLPGGTLYEANMRRAAWATVLALLL